MEKKTYEPHFFADPAFPIIFHYDVAPQDNIYPPHWHENLEILYFTHGAASVGINTETFSVSEGEMVIVPSNALHIVQSISDQCRYYCLIVDRDFCVNFGFKLDEICFAKKISDPHLNRKMDVIVHEFKDKKDFYQSEILSAIISMIVYLARHHLSSATQTLSKVETSRLEMVKCAFLYIEQNYEKDLTVDQGVQGSSP